MKIFSLNILECPYIIFPFSYEFTHSFKTKLLFWNSYHYKKRITFPNFCFYPWKNFLDARTGLDVEQDVLNLQINSKSVCVPLFILFGPDYHHRFLKIFCYVRDIDASRKKNDNPPYYCILSMKMIGRMLNGFVMWLRVVYELPPRRVIQRKRNRRQTITHVLEL